MSAVAPYATYADLRAAPPNCVAELIAGGLHTQPRPAPRHALANSQLLGDLRGPFDRGRGGPGGWIILAEPELHLGNDVLVPDIAGWRRTTLPQLPETPYFATAPDWVAELLSPSTAQLDRKLKMPIYARAGVGHVWLIDPLARTLEAYERVERGWLLIGTFGDSDSVSIAPFAEVPLALGELWRE
jgi:Uma2 family endonuclease